MRHASGEGPAAVAAWIHMSKFILGYSEKMLREKPADPDSNEAHAVGAKQRLFERLSRIADRYDRTASHDPPVVFR